MTDDRAPTHTGGCQCGAVRYAIYEELGAAGFCHCRMCQKAFGSIGAPLVSVEIVEFAWTRGSPSTFRSSPTVERGFCGTCGTPLFKREEGQASIDVAIGTLDDPNDVVPTSQIGIESQVKWFSYLHEVPGSRTDEQRSLEEIAKLASNQHPDRDTEFWPPP